MENLPSDADDIQNEAELREVLDKLWSEYGIEDTDANLLDLDFILWGAQPNAALTLAACRRRFPQMPPATIFPIIRDLEKHGIFERVPGHKPVAWRTTRKQGKP